MLPKGVAMLGACGTSCCMCLWLLVLVLCRSRPLACAFPVTTCRSVLGPAPTLRSSPPSHHHVPCHHVCQCLCCALCTVPCVMLCVWSFLCPWTYVEPR